MAKSLTRFPKKIFVRIEKDTSGDFLNAFDGENDAVETDEQLIATYELVETRKGKLVPRFS